MASSAPGSVSMMTLRGFCAAPKADAQKASRPPTKMAQRNIFMMMTSDSPWPAL